MYSYTNTYISAKKKKKQKYIQQGKHGVTVLLITYARYNTV